MYLQPSVHGPDTSAGPDQRAGLNDAPVAGPKIRTPSASAPPATPFGASGLTAVPITAHTRMNVPTASARNGSDWLDGGPGSDSLRGGGGKDTCVNWELRNRGGES